MLYVVCMCVCVRLEIENKKVHKYNNYIYSHTIISELVLSYLLPLLLDTYTHTHDVIQLVLGSDNHFPRLNFYAHKYEFCREKNALRVIRYAVQYVFKKIVVLVKICSNNISDLSIFRLFSKNTTII